MAGVSSSHYPPGRETVQRWKRIATFLAFPVVAGVCGAIAWDGFLTDAAASASLILLLLWARARSRVAAAAVVFAYFTGASWSLLVGSVVYFDSILTAAFVWAGAGFLWCLPWVALWGKSHVGRRAAIALALSVLPPLGIIGWASPLLTAGVCFPGCGTAGMVVMFLSCCVIAHFARPAPRISMAIATLLAIGAFIGDMPYRKGILLQGIDTRGGSPQDDFVHVAAFDRAVSIAAESAPAGSTLVFPEAALVSPSVARTFLRDGLKTTTAKQIRVISGAREGTAARPRNVLEDLVTGEVIAESRMPPPAAMWQPWRDDGGYSMRWEANGMSTTMPRTAVLICYETVLVWPGLISTLQRPTRLIVVANLWFDRSGRIEAAERQAAHLWARLWDAELAIAVNQAR